MSILFNKQPQILNVELAELIGLNEAIVLQQVHYWIDINKKAGKNLRKGRFWTYNTFENWQKDNFPYWSVRTLNRIFKNLQERKLLITDNFNKKGFDRTKWYTIDYDNLKKLEESLETRINTHYDKMAQSENINVSEDNQNNSKSLETRINTHYDKMAQSLCHNDIIHYDKMARPIPETKKENNNRDYNESSHSQVKSIEKEENIKNMTGQGHDLTNKNMDIENLKKKKEILKQQKQIEELKQKINELKQHNQKEEETEITDLHKCEFYEELLKNNLAYDFMYRTYYKPFEKLKESKDKTITPQDHLRLKQNADYIKLIDTFINIMAETMASNKKHIKINQEDVGQALVSKKFEMITQDQFYFAIDQYKEFAQMTNVKFPKQYILTCLFNATTEAVPKTYTSNTKH